MDLKGIFRSKQTSAPEKRRKAGKTTTAGAHELFLEYEGFLSSSNKRPHRPLPCATRIAPPQTPAPDKAKLSRHTSSNLHMNHRTPQESLSDFPNSIDEARSQPCRVPSARKKGLFPLSRLAHDGHQKDDGTETSSVYQSEQKRVKPSSSHSWLRRCLSTTSRRHPSPPPSFTTIASHYACPIFEDDDLTALPALPGYEDEHSKDIEKPLSGRAARAAAAAQNEVLQNMQNLQLAEPKLTRDCESGVGIEVRDHEEVIANYDIPVVRIDPLSVLPEELIGQILTYLDSNSLINAELISHSWYRCASSYHVWRDVFRAEFQNACSTVASIPSGSPQRVNKMLARRDWKSMWRARKALEQRWRDGHAAAIYLEGHTDSVYCVQFDEDKIITGSRDRTVRIWDARTYECVKVLGVPTRGTGSTLPPPLPTDVSDRGHRPFKEVFPVISGSAPIMTSRLLCHTGSILCLQYDDQTMITGSSDCTLIVWDVEADYKPVMRLRRHTAGVLDVCFDDRHIVSCSKDSTVCLWDRKSGDFLRKMSGHRGPVNAVQLRGDLVVSASGDSLAKLWNIRSGLCIKEFASKDRGMACVEFSPDSRYILAGGNDQVVYQFDTTTGELVREMKGHEDLVRSLYLDSANGRVVSGSYDMSVRAYDLRNGEMIVNFVKWTSSWILSAKADYRRIVATSQDRRAVIMDFGYQLPGIELLEA